MGGGMEASKNKFIEEWGSARENLEHNFRWTRRNFALVGIFGIAIPVLVYKGIVKEFGFNWNGFYVNVGISDVSVIYRGCDVVVVVSCEVERGINMMSLLGVWLLIELASLCVNCKLLECKCVLLSDQD
ncbi:putative malate:quinone oxidoreductase [Bienertia sinuspersici]